MITVKVQFEESPPVITNLGEQVGGAERPGARPGSARLVLEYMVFPGAPALRTLLLASSVVLWDVN